jgi:hypothetical protein
MMQETAKAVQDGKLTNELFGQIYRKVGEIVRRVVEGTLAVQWVLGQLQRIVQGPGWKVWKTIQILTYKTLEECRSSLEGGGFIFTFWAKDLLCCEFSETAEETEEVNFAKITVAELGFNELTPRQKVYERAIEMGLKLCRPTDGPSLRIHYKDQPTKNDLWLAMASIPDSHRNPAILCLRRSLEGYELSGGYLRMCEPDICFVFRFPSSK